MREGIKKKNLFVAISLSHCSSLTPLVNPAPSHFHTSQSACTICISCLLRASLSVSLSVPFPSSRTHIEALKPDHDLTHTRALFLPPSVRRLLLRQCRGLWSDITPCGGELAETSLHYLFLVCQHPAVSKPFPPIRDLSRCLPAPVPSSFTIPIAHPSPLAEGSSLSSCHVSFPPSHTCIHDVSTHTNAAFSGLRWVCTVQHNLKIFPVCVCETPSVRLT